MKIQVNKESFVKTWNLAERNASTSGSMNIFSTVRVIVGQSDVELQATDIRTSIICKAGGVTVVEPGEAVIPIKGVSELFKKAGASDFTLQVEGGRAVMISGKSRYKFSTYPVGDFPKLPSSEKSRFFCSLPVSKMIFVLERGTLCASSGDEYPQYLSSAYIEMERGFMNVVSTDKRRLALCRTEVYEGSESEPVLIPMKGVKELLRILGMIDSNFQLNISSDDSQVFFATEGMEFSIRRVESKFPSYAKILPTSHTTCAEIDKASLLSILERVDVVVRDYNRLVMVNIEQNGECVFTGRAREFGEAVENAQCKVDGESLFIAFNTRFFYDAVKALGENVTARLLFNGKDGHMVVRASDSDKFICLLAPVELNSEEITGDQSESEEVDVL
ncbi:MAG: DNA polymerase III subunit beta [Synergistaceae bacterium]|jgi:DNA polymerase-3 subunit beta|nr:DNA polymerase III subunit beta [Synergistaceae bacterium]